MTPETQVFRPTKKYWLNWFVITILGSFMLMLIGLNLFNRMREATNMGVLLLVVFLAILLLVSFAYNYKTTWPFPWIIQFTVSETAVSGFNGTTTFNINWDDFIFLHYEKQKNNHWLFLATQDEDIHFSLDHLPATAVWQTLEKQANPAILKEDGYQQVVERDIAQTDDIYASINLPLIVKPSRIIHGLLIWGSLFFASFIGICWAENLWGFSIFFLFETLLSVYSLLQLGTVKFDRNSIDYKPWKRHYQIQWDDINHIEADSQANSLVFRSTQQQLVIPGFMVYPKQDRHLMSTLLDYQKNQRQLTLHTSWKAIFRQQKNTRVKT